MSIQVEIDNKKITEFCKRHHVRKLSLFGSVLRKDFRSDSDLDVLVEFEKGHTPGLEFVAMGKELSDLLGRKVDLNTPNFLSPYFKEQVLQEAQAFYKQA